MTDTKRTLSIIFEELHATYAKDFSNPKQSALWKELAEAIYVKEQEQRDAD